MKQPITEFLRTAVTDNPENYPQNDFFEVDDVPQLDNLNQLLEVYSVSPQGNVDSSLVVIML
jgi:hypothetical protein